jgi:hypothetical protein
MRFRVCSSLVQLVIVGCLTRDWAGALGGKRRTISWEGRGV